MKVMGLDHVEAVKNQIKQMQKRNKKTMIFKDDKTEICVNGNLKGGWLILG